jgi:hypothetical protein
MSSPDSKFPVRYLDPDYQQNHRNLFSGSLLAPLEPVLPPGLTQSEFDRALTEFRKAIGDDQVFVGLNLEEYVDPYELYEKEGRRKTPSAAVWYVSFFVQSRFYSD